MGTLVAEGCRNLAIVRLSVQKQVVAVRLVRLLVTRKKVERLFQGSADDKDLL